MNQKLFESNRVSVQYIESQSVTALACEVKTCFLPELSEKIHQKFITFNLISTVCYNQGLYEA